MVKINNKAEFSIQGMIYGLLVIGLISAVLGNVISYNSGTYDTTGYDAPSVTKYNAISTLNNSIRDSEKLTDEMVVKEDLFDYFAGIWYKLTEPFKTVYRSYATLQALTNDAVDDLQLMPVFKDFIILAIIVFVMIGIVLFRFYLKVR